MLYDGTDPVSNGLVLAGSVGFVLLKLLHKLVTLPRRLMRREEKHEEKSENVALDMFKFLMK
jgi:hypothetical protein